MLNKNWLIMAPHIISSMNRLCLRNYTIIFLKMVWFYFLIVCFTIPAILCRVLKRFNFNKSNDRSYNVISSQIQSNVFNYTHAHTQNHIDMLMYYWWPCWMCLHRSGQHSWYDFQFYKHIFVQCYATYCVALTWAPNDQEIY